MTTVIDDVDIPIAIADAVPILPPRPDALVTLLTTDDFLPGAQTLLYSIKKTLPKNQGGYPPEVVVLVTPRISKETRAALYPALCTRIIEVDPISFPENSIQNKQVVSSHVESWGIEGSLSKLHIFRLEVYDTILYIDADCLVLKDVSHLLDLGKVYQESDALIAAAPDIFPPDKFNAGVLIVRPSKRTFDNMLAQSSLLTTYDGGDTGFLNAYFSDWFTHMPPMARLKFGYNAQRFLYHCTYDKQPNYWDLGVSPDLHILHFSSSPKPWNLKPAAVANTASAQEHLDQEGVKNLQKVSKTAQLEQLWWTWYKRSQNYIVNRSKECLAELNDRQNALARKKAIAAKPKTAQTLHKLIVSRYKELRREGKDARMAMEQARLEFGQNDANDASPNSQVARLFGLAAM